MPINTISTILSSVKSATDIGQLLIDAHSSYDKAQLKVEIEKLVDALHDVKKQTRSLEDTLYEKDQEIKRLKEELVAQESKVKVSIVGVAAYVHNKNNIPSGLPICPNCYRRNGDIRGLTFLRGVGFRCSSGDFQSQQRDTPNPLTGDWFNQILNSNPECIEEI